MDSLQLLSLNELQILPKVIQAMETHAHEEHHNCKQRDYDDHCHSLLTPPGEREVPCLALSDFHELGAARGAAKKVNKGRTRPGLIAPLVCGRSSSSQRHAVTLY